MTTPKEEYVVKTEPMITFHCADCGVKYTTTKTDVVIVQRPNYYMRSYRVTEWISVAVCPRCSSHT